MNGKGISDGLAPERTVEFRVRKNGRKDKVIIETSAAEGLPEGWIKKLEITYKPGRKYRRDAFFIDPKSEYVFQSFKDATRYVETGDIGQYARKLKESDIEDDDSGNGKNLRCLDSVEKRSSDSLLENEKKTDSHVRNSKRRNISSCDELAENCKMNSELSSLTSQVPEDLVKEETKDPIEKQPIVKRVTRSQLKSCKNEVSADLKRKVPSSSNAKSEDCVESRLSSARSQDLGKESVMKKEEVQHSTEKWTTTSKATVQKNKLSNSVGVARRASKRLAGIELEPTPELKTKPKAQRIVSPDEPTPELKTRPKAQRIVSPDDEPTPELKTRPKAQRTVTLDDEPTPELKTGPKAQRIVTPDNEPTAELNTRTKAPQKLPPDNELMPERKTRTSAQQIVTPGDEQTPELNRKTKAKRKVLLSNELMPERKRRTRAQRIVPSDNGMSGKCKPYDVAATNNNVDAEMAVGNEKFSKPVGRNSSRDKKKIETPAMIFELNPFFHLDGYEPKEEVSPVSLLSGQTSATKHEKTRSPVSPLSRQTSATKHEKTVSPVSPFSRQTSATKREKFAEGKRLGQSSPKTKLTTSVKVTEIIPPLKSSSAGKYPHPSDSSNANQRINQLGNEFSQPSVVRGTCSEVMEKNATNSFALDSTLADLWKDPCIAFAIKTLTGDSISLPNTAAISSDPMNNQTKEKGVSFLPETHETVNSCAPKPGFPSAPSGAADLWTDPCIDFAIKTLTGAIPVGLDEPDAKSKSEGMKMTSTTGTAATQESEGRRKNSLFGSTM